MHWFHVNPRSGVPIYVQLKEQIKAAAAGGILPPGSQLPSVRDLAVSLTINPNTVVRAYTELEREGLLQSEQGRGTFVTGAGSLLKEEERMNRVGTAIDRVLVEAYHYQVPPEKLAALWEERVSTWRERLFRGGTEKEDRS